MDTTEDLIAASLVKHAADAPSDEHLLSTLHHRLRLRRTGRAIGAVVLRYYEDLPDAEIAAILDCSPATIRSQIHRALATLRTTLTPAEEAT